MSTKTDANGIYPRICRKAGTVRESARSRYGFPYTERHLQCLWFDPRLRPEDLASTEGEALSVVSPGRWNLEAGPDFLDATLLIGPGRRRLSGDVEVHIHPSDWQAHRHSEDPRYSRVVAHVSYFRPNRDSRSVPPGLVQVCLKDHLNADPAFTFEAIDTAAYPFSEHAAPTPCSAVLAGMPPGHVSHLLECAGRERLAIKAGRMSAAIREFGADQALYEEILCALGYRDNRVPFRRLARILPLETLHAAAGKNPRNALALLLGVSGLLPPKLSPRWDAATRAYLRKLWDFWWKAGSPLRHRAMQTSDWKLAGLRPQNHPVRRMAAAAAIFCGPDPLPAVLARSARLGPSARIESARDTLASLRPEPYWERRLVFSGAPGRTATALLGDGRIAAITSNVLVPFVAATRGESPDLVESLDRLPAEQESSVTRLAAFLLLGADRDPRMFRTALRQQGLMQMFHDFCLNDRSGCAACGLPAALRAWEPDPLT